MRKSARVSTGVREAFSEVSSLAFLEALTADPQEAQVEQERQTAEKAMREKETKNTREQEELFTNNGGP